MRVPARLSCTRAAHHPQNPAKGAQAIQERHHIPTATPDVQFSTGLKNPEVHGTMREPLLPITTIRF